MHARSRTFRGPGLVPGVELEREVRARVPVKGGIHLHGTRGLPSYRAGAGERLRTPWHSPREA